MSSLLQQLFNETQESIASDTTRKRCHGEKFFIQVTGQEIINGNTFLVGNEIFRGLDGIKIHVSNPPQGTQITNNSGQQVALRNFSDLMANGAVVVDDMVCFNDVEPVAGLENHFVAGGYSTPMNKIDVEGVIKDTEGYNGYMTLESVNHYPSVVLYQSEGAYKGSFSEFKKEVPSSETHSVLSDGLYVPRLDTKEDIVSWATAQFKLRRPVTVRLIVDTGGGNYQALPVRVNPVYVDKPSSTEDGRTYKELDVDISLKSFIDNSSVQKLFGVLDRMSQLPDVKIGDLHKGANVLVEGIPTLKISDKYRNVTSDYVKDKSNVFKTIPVTYGDQVVNEQVCASAMLLVRKSQVDSINGPITVTRVAPGSGLLSANAEMYTLATMPSLNYQPSAPSIIRNVDTELKNNYRVLDNPAIKRLIESLSEGADLISAGSVTADDILGTLSTPADKAISPSKEPAEQVQPKVEPAKEPVKVAQPKEQVQKEQQPKEQPQAKTPAQNSSSQAADVKPQPSNDSADAIRSANEQLLSQFDDIDAFDADDEITSSDIDDAMRALSL